MALPSHLSRGMAIDANVEAHLLGKRLLTLKAKITVLPAQAALRRRTSNRRATAPVELLGAPYPEFGQGLPSPARPILRSPNGESSGPLGEAAQSLSSSAANLRTAREKMPRGDHLR